MIVEPAVASRTLRTEQISCGLVVVGGGPTGCEIATALARRAGAGARISLVAPPPLLAAFSGRARRTMEHALGEAGIRLVSASVESATPASSA
jgi:NADH dehydrogenase FAD-containing subunit